MKHWKDSSCEICNFGTPRVSTTAIIIKDNKLLCISKGEYLDLPGGFSEATESPEKSLRRELVEELGVEIKSLEMVDFFPGIYVYEDNKIPVTAVAYLVEKEGEIKLGEGDGYAFYDIKGLDPEQFKYETDQKVVNWIKEHLTYDWKKVKKLMKQLDPSAEIQEINLYKSILNGYLQPLIEDGELVGMGWIYPRRTLLRKQGVVEDMIVDEPLRGQGRGEKILMGLLNRAKSEGTEVAELTTNPKRESANKLYKKVGFWLHETNHYLKEL